MIVLFAHVITTGHSYYIEFSCQVSLTTNLNAEESPSSDTSYYFVYFLFLEIVFLLILFTPILEIFEKTPDYHYQKDSYREGCNNCNPL